LSRRTDESDEELSDEIKREDGLERHWLYFNGETYAVYAFIAFLFFLACLGVVYLFGKNEGPLGVAAAILAVACLMVGIGIHGRLREYQVRGWKKDWRTPRVERVERRIALYV
jgi:hypothetical protein